MFRRLLEGIIALFILSSLILQILVILGNFNGLEKIYILRADLTNNIGLLNDILNILSANYLTVSLFRVCVGLNTEETCSPPSWGFQYNSTGILETIESNIPESIHETFTGVQAGVFIPSVIFCFLLLLVFIYAFSTSYQPGCCGLILMFILKVISLLFSLATFIIQIIVYNQLKDKLNSIKESVFGGLFSSAIGINTQKGTSIWISLASFILLLCVLVLLIVWCLTANGGKKVKKEEKKRWFTRPRRREEYEMGSNAL